VGEKGLKAKKRSRRLLVDARRNFRNILKIEKNKNNKSLEIRNRKQATKGKEREVNTHQSTLNRKKLQRGTSF